MQTLPPILVAEDDDDDFHFLRRAAREAGVENPILRFRDGAELIKFIAQVPPAELDETSQSPWLLLLDLGMPFVNGFEVLTWLRAHHRLPRVRSVVLSGFYHPADIERARALGATDYVMKPITAQGFAALMCRPENAVIGAAAGR